MSLLAESGDYYWQSDTLPLIFVKERHKNGDNNDNNGDKQTIRNFIKKWLLFADRKEDSKTDNDDDDDDDDADGDHLVGELPVKLLAADPRVVFSSSHLRLEDHLWRV